jgi:hypothetical protein
MRSLWGRFETYLAGRVRGRPMALAPVPDDAHTCWPPLACVRPPLTRLQEAPPPLQPLAVPAADPAISKLPSSLQRKLALEFVGKHCLGTVRGGPGAPAGGTPAVVALSLVGWGPAHLAHFFKQAATVPRMLHLDVGGAPGAGGERQDEVLDALLDRVLGQDGRRRGQDRKWWKKRGGKGAKGHAGGGAGPLAGPPLPLGAAWPLQELWLQGWDASTMQGSSGGGKRAGAKKGAATEMAAAGTTDGVTGMLARLLAPGGLRVLILDNCSEALTPEALAGAGLALGQQGQQPFSPGLAAGAGGVSKRIAWPQLAGAGAEPLEVASAAAGAGEAVADAEPEVRSGDTVWYGMAR